MAFTYNDPVVFAEYAIDVAQACHERGLRTVAVTAGYTTDEARPEFYRAMDAANVDLKAFTENFYHRLCFAELRPVLDTLVYLRKETSVWFEVVESDFEGFRTLAATMTLAAALAIAIAEARRIAEKQNLHSE